MLESDSTDANKATLVIGSGSKVVVWELDDNNNESENQPRTFDPYPEYDDGIPISSLAWNHNQMVIAISSGISTDEVSHDNIVLLSSQSGQVLDSFQHDAEWRQKGQSGNAARSVNFGGKSRYLCIGDESGAVCLWDLKKKIRVRQFFHATSGRGSSPSPSHQVSLDPKDTYVLSLSPSALYQYNLRDGQLVGKLVLPQDSDGNDIDVSHFTIFSISDLEPSLVAIGADDGSVYVHNIANPSLQGLANFEMAQKHNGEVTGLAFSPVNPNILFSCGSDGNILVHNKKEQTSFKIGGALESNQSTILSMSLHANGTKCAVGCQSGDVFVYNFHSSNGAEEPSLLASFQASEPVHSLCFAPPPRAKDKKNQSDKTKSSNTGKDTVDATGATNQTKTSLSDPKTKDIPQSKTVKQKPVSPKGSASPNKPKSTSPFARKLASLTSISKNAKQQKAAAVNTNNSKRTTHRAPLSPRRFSSLPENNKYNTKIQPKESPTRKSPETNVRKEKNANRSALGE